MPEQTIEDYGKSAIKQTNELLRQANKPVLVDLLNTEDLEWCIAAMRNVTPERQLPWHQMGYMLREENAFNFCFKLTDKAHRVAGACLCEYCPADNVLNVEMLQNFRITPSVLDGNLFRFALYTIVLFLLGCRGKGVRIMFPVNRKVASYYIEKFDFYDITDDNTGDILYRDTSDLIAWFVRDTALVEGE